jgi:hypothetical protein
MVRFGGFSQVIIAITLVVISVLSELTAEGQSSPRTTPSRSTQVPLTDSERAKIARWEAAFRQHLAANGRRYEDMAKSGKAHKYYNLQYILDALLSMYEATDKREYLDTCSKYVDMMIESAVDRGNGIPEWTGDDEVVLWDGKKVSGNRYPTLLLNDFQGSVAIARLGRLLKEQKGLARTYGDRSAHYLQFVEKNVLGKWLGARGALPGMLNAARNPSMACRMSVDISHATPSQFCTNLAEEIAKTFRARLVPRGSGYIWDPTLWIGFDGNQEGCPDTAHSNREATLVVVAFKSGVVFSQSDVLRMARTFTDSVWNGSISDPRFANYLNGSNQPYRKNNYNGDPAACTHVYDGWIKYT